MATANFNHPMLLDKYYVLDLDFDAEFDSCAYEYDIEDLQECLRIKMTEDNDFETGFEMNDHTIEIGVNFKDVWTIGLTLELKSGYYQAASFVMTGFIMNEDGDEFEILGEMIPDLDIFSDIQSHTKESSTYPDLLLELDKIKKAIQEVMDQRYEKYSCLGVASNGEAFYKKC